jgi:anti-sigma-K factor RskA
MSDPMTPGLTCDEVREMAGAYVLGALEPADEAAVRAHLASHADGHPEIAELGSVLPALADSVPVVEPPDGLKARIMAAAAADLAARSSTAVPSSPAVTPAADSPATATEPSRFPSASERTARRRASTGTWILRIAAVLAIVALGGWNLLLQGQLNAAKTYEQSVAAVLDVAAKPGSLTAILTADGGPGSGLAAIDANGQVTLAMQDLAPTGGSTVYEAWIIGSDGVPVPLGSFSVGSAGTASLTAPNATTEPGSILALTHEPGPGAQTPTLPIISKGVATAAG